MDRECAVERLVNLGVAEVFKEVFWNDTFEIRPELSDRRKELGPYEAYYSSHCIGNSI